MAIAFFRHLERVRAMASVGHTVAIAGTRQQAASEITLVDVAKHATLKTLPVPTNVSALTYDGLQLVAGGHDGALHRFDPVAGTSVGRTPAHQGEVTGLAAFGGWLASVGLDGRVVLWQAGTAKHEFSVGTALRAVALDVANKRVAFAGDDSRVRVLEFGSTEPRVMEGHSGPVTALAFTPRDGRLVSTGDDGTLRLWYLEGEVECEVRGEGDTGHAGGATGLVFLPSPADDADDTSDRVVSVGLDAKIRTTRLDDKKRSKTLDVVGALRAVCVVDLDGKQRELVVAGDARTVTFIKLAPEGVTAISDTGSDGFAHRKFVLSTAQRAAKEAMAKEVAPIPESEALPLLAKLGEDKESAVRIAVARALTEAPRRDAKPLLRQLVRDKDGGVGRAALDALLKVELTPFDAWREGLKGSAAEVRIAALAALPSLYPAVPLVPAALSGALGDVDAKVRLAAVDALQRVFPSGPEALTLAFERGATDVRVEVLVRALKEKRLGLLQSVTGRALDDDAAHVRNMAYAVRVLERPALAKALEGWLTELPEVLRRANGQKDPTPAELPQVRRAVGLDASAGELTQDDLTPLLVAMSAKATDIASRGAVGLLVAANDVRAVSALLQLSREEPAQHRVWVAKILAQVKDPRGLQRLASMIDDADAAVRAAAAEGLVKNNVEHLTQLLLKSAHEDMRKRGLTRLVAVPAAERTEAVVEQLGVALEDEAAAVRSEAFKTLWVWHERKPHDAVDRALLARFADVRKLAVDQLALAAKAPTDDDAAPPKSIPEWVLPRVGRAAVDRDAGVGQAGLTLWSRLVGHSKAEPSVKALASESASVRVAAASRAKKVAATEAEQLRSPLLKALADSETSVKLAALESLDVLVKDDAGPLMAGLLADTLEVRVRAAELLAKRGDERMLEPMRSVLLDADLKARYPKEVLEALRSRAADALATLGSPRMNAWFVSPLLQDENPAVREQSARGLCNAGAQQQCLDALAHTDVAVRSWAAEGLARLGDSRGLAVLTGTLRDPHLPIREGALRALVALGNEGDHALLLGLDDADAYLSDTFFATLVARDVRAAREGNEPTLLTAALSARRVDARFAAARALELRSDVPAYTALALAAVSPPLPEKASELKDWPPEAERERSAMRLVQLLAADTTEDRYAAGQALLLRRKPLEFFAEVNRVVALRPATQTQVPDTSQRGRASTDATAKRDWLRKLFAGVSGKAPTASVKEVEVQRWLAFGAYVGLLRLSVPDDLVRKVRRDSVERMVAMAESASPTPASVVPALVRALDDEDALVRKKALAGLHRLLPQTPDVVHSFALSASSADVGVVTLDALAAQGPASRPRFVEALASRVPEVRHHAFTLLERSHGPGSLEAMMAALASPHSDVRLGVLDRLAASRDARVTPALRKALESDRPDVRLKAAELLAQRQDDACAPALEAFLVHDGESLKNAREALAVCGTDAAAAVLVTHLDALAQMPVPADPGPLKALKREAMAALAKTRRPAALEALVSRFEDTDAELRLQALGSALSLTNHRRPPEVGESRKRWAQEEKVTPRDGAAALKVLSAAAKAKDPAMRRAAAKQLDVGVEREADSVLVSLFADRDVETRVAAVTAYSRRVMLHQSPLKPLEAVAAQGARELLLPAAEGLAAREQVAGLQPLLLLCRAGELEEQQRAVLALGRGGYVKALEELELMAAGGTEEAPVDPSLRSAAYEALGFLYAKLPDADVRKRVYETVEAAALEGAFQRAGAKGLRHIGDDRAKSRLQQLMVDSGSAIELRIEAVNAAALLKDESAEKALTASLNQAQLAPLALEALETIFASDPLRVALNAASSENTAISGPALAYLLAEAEPAPLLDRLANPKLNVRLRTQVKYGLGRRPHLPTAELLKHTQSEAAGVRDDMAWLMAQHVLKGVAVPGPEMQQRAKALADAASATAQRWLKAVGTDKAAEGEAFSRLLWAATLHAANDVSALAAKALAGSAPAPALVRAQAARALIAEGAAAVPLLNRAAADIDGTVRRAAVAALVRVGSTEVASLISTVSPVDAMAFESLKPQVQLLETEPARAVALPGLIADKQSQALMAQLKSSADEGTLLAALAALGRIAGDEVVAFLEGLAFSAGRTARKDDDGEDDEGDEDEGDADADDEESSSGPSPDVSMPGARRFEFEEDGSSKFWEVLVQDTTLLIRFGKIGAAGQKKPKKFANAEAAQKEADKLVKEKTGKGYEEVKPRGAAPPKAAASPAAEAPVAAPSMPWATATLRKAAFRALRRAQRLTARRAKSPRWFTADELTQLETNPGFVLPAPTVAGAARDTSDEDDDEEDFEDEDE
jgi:ParB family transcriptional regulator, chromosome partitioning protein